MGNQSSGIHCHTLAVWLRPDPAPLGLGFLLGKGPDQDDDPWAPPPWVWPPDVGPLPTSTDEADGTKETGLSVVHLQGQQLIGEGEDEVCEGAEAGIVHLGPVQGQPVREGHCVLLGRVPRADPQDLGAEEA